MTNFDMVVLVMVVAFFVFMALVNFDGQPDDKIIIKRLGVDAFIIKQEEKFVRVHLQFEAGQPSVELLERFKVVMPDGSTQLFRTISIRWFGLTAITNAIIEK